MQETMYVPGEVIYKKGEADQKIFYIVKGDVEFYIEDKVLGEVGVINIHNFIFKN